jgi:hypothetical protein
MLTCGLETGKAVLREYVNVTVGFHAREKKMHIPVKTLVPMLGPKCSPTMANWTNILRTATASRSRAEVVPIPANAFQDARAVAGETDKWLQATRPGVAIWVKVRGFIGRQCSPDRVLDPIKRVGPKETGAYERTSWHEALELIAERFSNIAKR